MSDDGDIVGARGVIVVATRGAAGPGEVVLRVRGGTEAFLAISTEPMARGEQVLVIEALGGRRVAVIPWSDTGLRVVNPDQM